MKTKTWHLHITGLVQGVGFRPYVYKLALKEHLKGWVNNTNDGVHVVFNSSKSEAGRITSAIINNAPYLARITGSSLKEVDHRQFDSFDIVHSSSTGKVDLLITPDFSMCKTCRQELWTKENKRFRYPFITCTLCGPRYSIITSFPYDRPNTSMDPFDMCPTCQHEYDDPLDRRYYSQTNSCETCGIEMKLVDTRGITISSGYHPSIENTIDLIRNGSIVAVKGIGGYLLMCDATNEKVIKELRIRKNRPSKAFALLYPDLDVLQADAEVDDKEMEELMGTVAAIVLLARKGQTGTGICVSEIAPGLNNIGVMLPYAPILELISREFGKPLIATSANISNSPILADDQVVLKELNRVADYFLVHDRDISIPQDDSVIRFSGSRKIILRRSRGIAPTYDNPAIIFPDKTILAAGADMKSSFTLLHNHKTYISQYLGDLSNYTTQLNYDRLLSTYQEMFDIRGDIVLCDMHPDYHSSRSARAIAARYECPKYLIQHHKAHFAAVLAENDLMEDKEKVLGVIWDGTGYGEDKQIWGGEFFVWHERQMNRIDHLPYFPHIARDKMALEPRISALSYFSDKPEVCELIKDKFTSTEWSVYNTLLSTKDKLMTSSMGRIFDAVASILGIVDVSSYEGEAAMYLENVADRYLQEHGTRRISSYIPNTGHSMDDILNTLKSGLIDDALNSVPNGLIAANFHRSLVDILIFMIEKAGVEKIAFSGGVFQNALLLDLIERHLGKRYSLYFHKELSPNDENISFGQLIYHLTIDKQN